MKDPLGLRLAMLSWPLGCCAMPPAHGQQKQLSNTKSPGWVPSLGAKGKSCRGGWQELSSKADTRMGVCLWNPVPHRPKISVRAWFVGGKVVSEQLWPGRAGREGSQALCLLLGAACATEELWHSSGQGTIQNLP